MAESGTKGTVSDNLHIIYILYKISSSSSSAIFATASQDSEAAVTSLIEENGWEYITSLEDLDALTFIHFIDIGGQPEFHEMLPLLLHQVPALNLLFLNMSQSLDDKHEVVYIEMIVVPVL